MIESVPHLAHGLRIRSRGLLILGLVALAGLLLIGCREEHVEAPVEVRDRQYEGDPRGFLLGFSDIPADLTDSAYIKTFDLAADYGEILLIQRAPAWTEFFPGGRVSDTLRDQVIAEREAARARGLTLMVALDPFDPGSRQRLNALPNTHQGRDLSDQNLRQAFINEAVFIARNMQPAYLVLGTEVNVAFERNPSGYEAFVAAYRDAYREVKAVAPETQVLVTFQYEELLGVIPDLPPHAPRWELLADFEDSMDLVGITTYPSFAFAVARKVPPRYYLDIADHTDLPVAFVSAGFASAPGRDGINSSTPDEQRRFLQRLIEDAERLGSPMIVWFAARDLRFAAAPPYDLIANIGLQGPEGEPKEAWVIWEATSNRPYDPEAAALARADLDDPEPTPTVPPAPDGDDEADEEPEQENEGQTAPGD
jgi:hypothetical protein